MNIIIPMAGLGKRLRPHTLNTPKPLLEVAGKPIVEHLVEDLSKVVTPKINTIAFVVGDLNEEAKQNLRIVAQNCNAEGLIYHQKEPLGTAHAVYCAEEQLSGPVIIAFADTLFRTSFSLDESKDGILWVSEVNDPRQYGVVLLDQDNNIKEMVEKPEHPISNLAIIGIYYLKEGDKLKQEIKHILDNNIKTKGEYQLTDALDNLRSKGAKLGVGTVNLWMDCGNKETLLQTNRNLLTELSDQSRIHNTALIQDSVIVPPCIIGENVKIIRSVIGPYVALGKSCSITNSIINDSIVRNNSNINGQSYTNSIIGSNNSHFSTPKSVNYGDYIESN